MPLEGIPIGIIMMTVTAFLTVSAFVVFGVTCYNMKKKRSSKVSMIGVDGGLSEDPTGVVVVPVVCQLNEDVKDTRKGDQYVNNEADGDDTSGAKSDDSDATMDADATDHGTTAVSVDTTAVAVDVTTLSVDATTAAASVDATVVSVDAAATAVDSSAVVVEANAS